MQPISPQPQHHNSLDPSFISNSESLSRQKTHHLIEYLTHQIGISKRSAAILVNAHECTTKGQVLELLTIDDDGFARHIFVPLTSGDVQLCQVCSQAIGRHTIIDPQLVEQFSRQQQYPINQYKNMISSHDQQQPHNNQESEQENQQQQNKILCEICYIDYQQRQISYFSSSSHSICLPCMNAYVDEKITTMQIESIYCPHCGVKLTRDVIKQFASQKAFIMYEQFIKNLQIQKNPNLMWCPNPKCAVVISITNKKKLFSCPKCQLKICSKCKRQSHKGKSCNSVFENQIKQWQNSQAIQRCKKCSSIVEKISGCNHMSCTICGHEWCWLCGANYSERHFSPMNPFGCAGLQNRDGVGKCRIWLWRVALFIIMLIAIPAAFPFALLLSGPFVAIEAFYKRVQYNSKMPMKIFTVVLGFIVGIVFDPIIWIGLVIVFAPRLCSAIREYFRNKRRRLEISQNRITERLINDAIVNSENIVFENGTG